METLNNLLIKIVCMVLFGFFLKKSRIITNEIQAGLSSLLLNAILPVSVLGSADAEATPEMVHALLWATLISACYYVAAFFMAKLLTCRIPMGKQKQNIFVAMNMFANVGFIGMPLCSALFGKEGFLIAVIYNLVYQIFLVFVGIPMMKPGKGVSWDMLKDPLLIMSMAALAIFASPFRLPPIIQEVCDDIGSMMVPVSMIIIGSDLANQKLSQIFQDSTAYIVSAMRLIVYPLAMYGILKIIAMPNTVFMPMVLLTALPSGSLNVILAKEYDCEPDFASRTVILSMILMIVTLPLVLYIIR